MAASGKDKALETTLATIQKRYGEGAIMRLGQASHLQVEAIPTGSLALDLALGVGGVPRGRVLEAGQHLDGGKQLSELVGLLRVVALVRCQVNRLPGLDLPRDLIHQLRQNRVGFH